MARGGSGGGGARQGCAPLDLKWSCGASQFCCWGERHLEPVRPLSEARGEHFGLASPEVTSVQ
ncbi:hypothetical protein L1I79_28525 [Strepomyces sp. STD 3.1]|nr:hypothetical protein [Streptomyces sp. STD 3.1]